MKKISKILAFLLVFAIILPGVAQAAPAVGEEKAIRLSGKTRVSTAVEASKEVYNKADSVVLVGYNGEVDALTGTLLANAKDAPVLVTTKDTLSPETAAEIKRLEAKTVYILGGENVVSKKVASQLKGYTVKRVAGLNRAETAVKVAKEVKGQTKHVFLSRGYDVLADALSAGPVSAIKDIPVLLTQSNKLSAETKNALKDLEVTHVTILGGEQAVSSNVEKELKNITVDRISGKDRFETSVKIANKYFDNPENIVVAYARKSTDALVGGYLGAKRNAPILLTDTNDLNPNTKGYLNINGNKSFVLGGTTVISEKVYRQIKDALKTVDEVIAEAAFNKRADKLIGEFNGKHNGITINYSNYQAKIVVTDDDLLETGGTGFFNMIQEIGIKEVKFAGKSTITVEPANYEALKEIALELLTSADEPSNFTVNLKAKIQAPGESAFTEDFTLNFIVK